MILAGMIKIKKMRENQQVQNVYIWLEKTKNLSAPLMVEQLDVWQII